tara:strand:+ start:2060 stop:3016 length:957 start_codon:yes stop_codon:yes gene_type:complete
MSNELSVVGAEDASEYLATLRQGEDEELAELRGEANPFQVMPKLVLSKDTKELRAVQNDETVATFSTRNPLYFVPILIAEHRALWAPGDEDSKMPVCSTARVKIGTFRRENDKGIGRWNVKDNRDLLGPNGEWLDDDYPDGQWPTELKVNCNGCPWNQFKSMPDWDTARETSKGKACGEGRLIVGYMAQQIGTVGNNVGLFSFDEDAPMVFMNVPSTSISAVHGIGNACVARRVPARYTVFALGNEPKSEGAMKWGTLTQEFAGFVDRPMVTVCDSKSTEMREMVFTKDLTPDIGETSQVKSTPHQPVEDIDEDEVPF